MLCERCHERKALVKIVATVNGVTETHNLCGECAAKIGGDENKQLAEWSQAIFKMLSGVAAGLTTGEEGRQYGKPVIENLTCPTCGKTFGEFGDNGRVGCGDCYEAFSPTLSRVLMNVQGADTHVGKRPGSALKKPVLKASDPKEEKLSKTEEKAILDRKLSEAVAREDYLEAARLRDAIKELAGKNGR